MCLCMTDNKHHVQETTLELTTLCMLKNEQPLGCYSCTSVRATLRLLPEQLFFNSVAMQISVVLLAGLLPYIKLVCLNYMFRKG